MMQKRIWGAVALNMALFLTWSLLFAHHGNAMYDHSQLTTLKGTISVFEFINPHARIILDVPTGEADVEQWQIELASSTSMRRRGWRSDTIKVGDQVTIMGYRKKDGSREMHMQKLLSADGKDLGG